MKIERTVRTGLTIANISDAEQSFIGQALMTAAAKYRDDARATEGSVSAQFIEQAERAERIAYQIEGM